MELDKLTKEQMDKVIAGMDMILEALGGETVSSILAKQEQALKLVAPGQDQLFLKAVHDQTAKIIGESVQQTANVYKAQLDAMVAHNKK